MALNRSMFKSSYQVATWEGREKMGSVLGGGRGWEGCWDRKEARGDGPAECSSCVCQTLLKASEWLEYDFTVSAWCGWSVCNS